MQVTTVTYMRRKTLAQYEHCEATVVVTLEEGDSREKAISLAVDSVNEAIGAKSSKVSGKVTTNAKPVKEEKKADQPVKEDKKEAVTDKPKKEKKTTKKAKDLSMDDVKAALRDYAKAKNSKEMAVEVMSNVTGTDKLASVDKKFYAKLVKALAV